MYNSTGYKKSKKVGDVGEDLLMDELISYGFIPKKNNDRDLRYDYDIICPSKNNEEILTFEVKYDSMASKTGNIAIEIFNTKKNEPSGVYATQAKYWIHIIDEDGPVIFICTTEQLKKFIESTTPLKSVEFGGNYNARLLIFQKDAIIGPLFKKISENIIK